MRGRHGAFPEYHTSADDLTFVSGERMSESLEVLAEIVAIVDGDRALRQPIDLMANHNSVGEGCTERSAAATFPMDSWRCFGS